MQALAGDLGVPVPLKKCGACLLVCGLAAFCCVGTPPVVPPLSQRASVLIPPTHDGAATRSGGLASEGQGCQSNSGTAAEGGGGRGKETVGIQLSKDDK